MRLLILTGWLLANSLQLMAGGEPAKVSASLRSVTIYRNGAELVHVATAVLAQGNNELIIDHVSNNLRKESIRVSGPEDVTILSTTFSNEYLRPEISPQIARRLTDSINVLKKEQSRLAIQIKANNDQLDLLMANRNIGGTSGVSLAELGKMMEYHKQKSLSLRTEIEEWQTRSKTLGERVDQLENQLEEEGTKNTGSGGRILLQLISPLGGTCKFTITYISAAAGWTPFYDLRVGNASEPLKIQYRARLSQTTGLDWKKVKLSLSTSTPGLDGVAPEMNTWFLAYVRPTPMVVGYVSSIKSDVLSEAAVAGRTPGLSISDSNQYFKYKIRGAATFNKAAEPLYVVDGVPVDAATAAKMDPSSLKEVQILKDASAIYGTRGAHGVVLITTKKMGDYVSVADNSMDVTFDLELPCDVPGNGKEQAVELKEYKMDCAYQFYSAPKLDKDVYLTGGLTGWEKLNLLPGEANIMVDGALIGKTQINPASVLDTLKLSLGRDKRIVVRREKMADYSSVKFLGTDKKQVFTYVINIKNNKKEAVQMELKDQYPISTSKEIESELLEASGAAADVNTGIRSWRLKLGAGESRTLKISYSVKYPKDRQLNLN